MTSADRDFLTKAFSFVFRFHVIFVGISGKNILGWLARSRAKQRSFFAPSCSLPQHIQRRETTVCWCSAFNQLSLLRPLTTIFTTFPEVGTSSEGEAFHRVARRAKLTRYGCDCYAYALLAAGQIDLVIEAGLQSYDIQAPIAVIEAAGGIVTNWEGQPVHDGGRALAAATPELHAAAMELLEGA